MKRYIPNRRSKETKKNGWVNGSRILNYTRKYIFKLLNQISRITSKTWLQIPYCAHLEGFHIDKAKVPLFFFKKNSFSALYTTYYTLIELTYRHPIRLIRGHRDPFFLSLSGVGWNFALWYSKLSKLNQKIIRILRGRTVWANFSPSCS